MQRQSRKSPETKLDSLSIFIGDNPAVRVRGEEKKIYRGK